MSDTPMTDSLLLEINEGRMYETDSPIAEHARKLERQLVEANAESDRRGNLLEDVINELDLSDSAISEHGQLGTPPAELVRLVLQQKDRIIRMLKAGMVEAKEVGGE